MNASVALGDEDPLGQPRVLLVDDDEVNLLLTSIALRERGFSITEATSGDPLNFISSTASGIQSCPAIATSLSRLNSRTASTSCAALGMS